MSNYNQDVVASLISNSWDEKGYKKTIQTKEKQVIGKLVSKIADELVYRAMEVADSQNEDVVDVKHIEKVYPQFLLDIS